MFLVKDKLVKVITLILNRVVGCLVYPIGIMLKLFGGITTAWIDKCELQVIPSNSFYEFCCIIFKKVSCLHLKIYFNHMVIICARKW